MGGKRYLGKAVETNQGPDIPGWIPGYSNAAKRFQRGLIASPEDYYEAVAKEVQREVDGDFRPIEKALDGIKKDLEEIERLYAKKPRGAKA